MSQRVLNLRGLQPLQKRTADNNANSSPPRSSSSRIAAKMVGCHRRKRRSVVDAATAMSHGNPASSTPPCSCPQSTSHNHCRGGHSVNHPGSQDNGPGSTPEATSSLRLRRRLRTPRAAGDTVDLNNHRASNMSFLQSLRCNSMTTMFGTATHMMDKPALTIVYMIHDTGAALRAVQCLTTCVLHVPSS